MNDLRINSQNGNFILNETVVFSTETRLDDLKLLLPELLTITEEKNDWSGAEYRNLKGGKYFFILNFTFFKGVLISMDIALDENEFGIPDGNGWDSFNYDEEMKKVDKYNAWLDSQFGEQRKFNWGNVAAGFDERGATPYLHIRFTAFETVFRASMDAKS